ncbi:hypothetical protein FHW83_004734 [Duganella sp. SG902]|uniref:DUF2635 domain-containing protein n=1 Tax=Duganella sp. SG902 TaxID=2587016 RepID=UPI0018578955|nr:DUF2635 domain-containing protein [Duganella sp. SG902]NVM78903.1 hypothetical protein [Duganella sp. SG902]
MSTIEVIATAGVKVPMEDKPNNYITDEGAVTVEDSTYYQRRISDGDLKPYNAISKKAAARAAADNANGG